MKLFRCLVIVATLSVSAACTPIKDSDAHTRAGDKMPPFTVEQTSGKTFSLAAEAGKVVVVNFWATWCGPCQLEMPRLQKEIWQQYESNPSFAMVAIAREQDRATVMEFQQKHPSYTFPMAFDPKRSTYALFASAGIPRTYVVDRHGKILLQTVGYSDDDFGRIHTAIQKALAEK